MSMKRRNLSSPTSTWSKLAPDVFESIIKRLSFLDILRCKYVCPSWNQYLSVSRKSCLFSFLSKPQTPFLMLPAHYHQEVYNDYDESRTDYGCCFLNIVEKGGGRYDADQFKNFWGYDDDDDHDKLYNCIGSSQGCLIILEEKTRCLFVFNPFRVEARKINLPARSVNRRIVRTILVPNRGKKLSLVMIYEINYCSSKTRILVHGENEWKDLPGSHCDIVSQGNQVVALCDNCPCVEFWDFGGLVPMKKLKIEIKVSFSDKLVEFGECFEDLYTTKLYLVESRGDHLLVERIIGNFVREDGVVVNEGALLDDEVYSHIDCAYMTKKFNVYKLDFGGKISERIESLGDEALFLGMNESKSVSSLEYQDIKGNSIYFTDDNLDAFSLKENYNYVGHDMGVFDLNDGSIKQIFPLELNKYDPLPLWLLN